MEPNIRFHVYGWWGPGGVPMSKPGDWVSLLENRFHCFLACLIGWEETASTQLQPVTSGIRLGMGWAGVYQWCRQSFEQSGNFYAVVIFGRPSSDGDVAFPGIGLISRSVRASVAPCTAESRGRKLLTRWRKCLAAVQYLHSGQEHTGCSGNGYRAWVYRVVRSRCC